MADNPRVLHLLTRFFDGGSERKTVATIEGLEDRYRFAVGHGAAFDPANIAKLEERGIETKRFPWLRHYNPVTAPLAVATIARYLRTNEFDIVHTHNTEMGIIGRAATALAGGCKVVHTVHGVPFSADRSGLLNRFVLGCERAVARHTDVIITNADAIADDYLERGIGRPEQYRTVYSGIDLDRFTDAEAVELPGTGPRALIVARLVDGKGFDVLLDAVERLDHIQFSVSIVGDGPLSDQLDAEISKRGLDGTVFRLGYRDDVPAVMASSDCLVLPSFREGTPRVITEAMATGLPVVATDIAGIPEQIADEENGFLIPTGDPEALASGLESLLTDAELCRQMGQRSVDRVERFSTERMIEALDSVYRSVLAAESSRSTVGEGGSNSAEAGQELEPPG